MDPNIIFLVVLVAIFYFMIIMPQRKKDKQTKTMIAALKVGDQVVTIGGICGSITMINDDTVTIESGADRTKIKLEKWSIRTVVAPVEA